MMKKGQSPNKQHNEITQYFFEEGNANEKQLTLLAEIAQNFSNSLDISQTLQNAIERFMQYLNSEAASIFLLESNNSELVCVRCAGPVDISGIRIPSEKGIIGNAINSRKSQMIRDAQNDPNFSKLVDADTGFITRSILAVPLVVNDECIGALELINKKNNDLFNEHDESIAMVLASYAALAIHNARMADALVEKERMRKELELAREIQIGLLPQSYHLSSGYRVQGKTKIGAEKIMDDAMAVQNSGAFAIVLEGIPTNLAKKITKKLSIPTVGIGAGPHCDGQIQVYHDILGLYGEISPRHCKRYDNLEYIIQNILVKYKEDVETMKFPTQEHSTPTKTLVEKIN